MPNQVRKIAILGGGISSLAAAFDLTAQHNWTEKYDITIYQLGWRLGGKGASSRNPAFNDRIEEHGLHIWLGFYENAFAMIRQCYGELGKKPGTFPNWQDAFKPHNYLVLEDKTSTGWMHWPISVPSNDSLPGSGGELPTVWDYVVMTFQWILELLEPRQLIPTDRLEHVTVQQTSAEVLKKELSSKERSSPRLGLKLVRAAERRARRMPRNSRKHSLNDRRSLLSLLVDFTKLMADAVPHEVQADPDVRRTWVTIDLFAAIIRGVLRDDVLIKGLDQLDGTDFRIWLKNHGAAQDTIDSALIRAAYDLAFSFEDGDPSKMNLAAGVALRALFRMVFTYKGGLLWKMQAGMGETVFTPLYHVLKARGVKFKFFNCVDSLHISDDRTRIAQIKITRQATCRTQEYDPLIRVNGLDCWHHRPDFEQLVEAEELRRDSINLESYWTPWPGVEKITLESGRDFDDIILGIPIEGLKQICASLIESSPKWKLMTQKVKTIQTQGFQLWLTKDLSECGWKLQSPILGAYVEPLDTWADMSHLLTVESWPASSKPKQVAYFCGVMETPQEMPPKNDIGFPSTAAAQCKAKAIQFLGQSSAHLWPKTSVIGDPMKFDWACLASSSGGTGPGRFDSQYWRPNIDPSERYTLALAGTTQYRLSCTESGFSNLILAGDWIRNGFNSPGCIESAVISGRQAARAITGSKDPIIGENDFTGPQSFIGWVGQQIQNVWDMFWLAFDKSRV